MLKKTNLMKVTALAVAISVLSVPLIIPEIVSGRNMGEKGHTDAAAQYTVPADDVLAKTGMPQEEISALDPDIKGFIAQHIDLNAGEPAQYIPVKTTPEVIENPVPFTIDGTPASADDVLAKTGMPQEEISALDPDIKEFIAQHIDLNAEEPAEYIETQLVNVPVPYSIQLLDGIEFSAKVVRIGNRVEIFPMYEFTTKKRPRGQDSFSVRVGNALDPTGYSGQVWYKNGYGNWTEAGMIKPVQEFLDGAEYAGEQLGNASIDVYVKGCGLIYADLTSGTSKKICITYMYNPNKGTYAYSLGNGLGVSYTSDKPIYSASQTIKLNY